MNKVKWFIIFGFIIIIINIIVSYLIIKIYDSANALSFSISSLEYYTSQINSEISNLESRIDDLEFDTSDIEDEISDLQRKIRYLSY